MKRRFIAGAVCPECKQLDKIVMFDDEQGRRWQECVACSFREMLVEPPRHDKVAPQVIKLVDKSE